MTLINLVIMLVLSNFFVFSWNCGMSPEEQRKLNAILMSSAFDNNAEVLKDYLEKGAKFDRIIKNEDAEAEEYNQGYTPLWVAAYKGSTQCVEILLEKGANVEFSHYSNCQQTPLFMAVFEGHLECVKLLINNGASVKIYNNRGLDPLAVAYSKGHLEIVDFLVPKIAEQYEPLEIDDDQTCCVCLNDYENNEFVIHFPCKHYVHALSCFKNYVLHESNEKLCPICRAYIIIQAQENTQSFIPRKIKIK